MISLLVVLVMTLETVFLDASVKHRNTLNAEIHRKSNMFPYTEEELDFINGKWK
jgi:hypothetical protein